MYDPNIFQLDLDNLLLIRSIHDRNNFQTERFPQAIPTLIVFE